MPRDFADRRSLFFHGSCDHCRALIDAGDLARDFGDNCRCLAHHDLDIRDMTPDFLGGSCRLARKRFDLACNHGEAATGLARPRRFDRCVQRKQVGLVCDLGDDVGDRSDLFDSPGKIGHSCARLIIAARLPESTPRTAGSPLSRWWRSSWPAALQRRRPDTILSRWTRNRSSQRQAAPFRRPRC
jgi:hypothetical protein